MWDPQSYTIAIGLLPRLLGFIYFCACGPFLFQMIGLLGKNGILPVENYLNQFRALPFFKRSFYIPSLFWFNSSDYTLKGLIILGMLISIVLMGGYYPAICLGLLFVIYLSIVSVGQDFLSFGWESFLLEITFYTILVIFTPVPNVIAWINLNFLLFRFHIQAGAVKLQSGDPAWRNMTGAAFHYESQPLPNTWAWYVYKWPLPFHKASTVFMFFVELIVPFGLFFSDEMRAITGFFFISLQAAFWLTGNLSYLNHLTACFCVISFSNHFFGYFSFHPVQNDAVNGLFDPLSSIFGGVFLVLQIARLWQHFQPHPFMFRWFSWFSPLHLINRYGLFAVMTKVRYEIVIEGSEDGETWKEYLCWFKPSEINRRPRRISPYQPRLDWQMWFLPFNDFESSDWFQQLLYQLLKGSPEVLKLFRHNPFPDAPPQYIRALMYDYHFSTKKQKKELGVWWTRDLLGLFSPTFSLKTKEGDN